MLVGDLRLFVGLFNSVVVFVTYVCVGDCVWLMVIVAGGCCYCFVAVVILALRLVVGCCLGVVLVLIGLVRFVF